MTRLENLFQAIAQVLKMHGKKLLAIGVATILVFALNSQFAYSEDLSATKIGERTCQELLDHSKQKKSKSEISGANTYWVMGFISGMNVSRALGVSKKQPVKTDAKLVRKLLIAHCKSNRGHSLLRSATAIYLALSRAQKQ